MIFREVGWCVPASAVIQLSACSGLISEQLAIMGSMRIRGAVSSLYGH